MLFCLPVLLAGWGLFGGIPGSEDAAPTPEEGFFYGSLSSSSVGGVTLLDPLAAAEAMAASKAFSLALLIGALPVLVVYGLIRGRAFCGWVCPVNLLGEGADWLRRKLGIAVPERTVPRRAKMAVAVAVVALSALVSIPVFELFSPIGAINKGLVFGGFAGLFTLAAILLCDLFVSRRLWCRALCPLGGVYEALGKVGLVSVRINHKECIHCNRCKEECLADPEILDPALAGEAPRVQAVDCLLCGKCIDHCPTSALKLGVGKD